MDTIISFLIGLLTFVASSIGMNEPDNSKTTSNNVVIATTTQEVASVTSDDRLYTAYLSDAKNIATSTLRKIILEQIPVLSVDKTRGGMDTKLQLKISAYLQEYVNRGLLTADNELNKMEGMLFDVIGPCWGVKEGECRE